jgi:hypothetical protein
MFLSWCERHSLDPLAAVRADIERYVRWLQEVRCYQPSTVSRRCRWWSASSASASSTASCRTRRPALVDVGQGDVPWTVLADPEGNEFCLLTPA